jgi:hypothetical protein
MSPQRGSLDPPGKVTRRAAAWHLQSSPDLRPCEPSYEDEGERKGSRGEQAGSRRQPEARPAPAQHGTQCLAPELTRCIPSIPSLEPERVQSAPSLGPEHGSFLLIERAGNSGKLAEQLAHPTGWRPGGAHSAGEPMASPRAKAIGSLSRSSSTRG